VSRHSHCIYPWLRSSFPFAGLPMSCLLNVKIVDMRGANSVGIAGLSSTISDGYDSIRLGKQNDVGCFSEELVTCSEATTTQLCRRVERKDIKSRLVQISHPVPDCSRSLVRHLIYFYINLCRNECDATTYSVFHLHLISV
jgi:hypothetical protein